MGRVRAEMPVVQRKLFFNTGWSGPSPRCVLDEQKRMLEFLSTEGVSHHIYKKLSKNIETLRSRLARILGADVNEITLTGSTTAGINIVLGGIDWRRGQKLVTTNIEHGAGLVPAYNLRDRYGVDVEIVDLSKGQDVLRSLSRAIDDRTRLVLVSHVSFNTGLRLPLKELAELVSKRRTELLVDGAQSVGVFPINLHGTGCDYYAFPGHKWLLGPDAVGGLYVRRDRIKSLAISFAGNETAKKFDREGNITYQKTAKKFEMADFNAALIAGWLKALDFMEELGLENIESAIKENTNYLKRRLSHIKALNVVTPASWAKSAGIVSIEIVGKDSKQVFGALLKKGIIVRYTPPPSYIRISVNYFNTREELDQLVDAIEEISRT